MRNKRRCTKDKEIEIIYKTEKKMKRVRKK